MISARLVKRARTLILQGRTAEAVKLARSAVARGNDPVDLVETAFAPGLREAGDLWNDGIYFLPELMRSAEAMKAVLKAIEPAMQQSAGAPVGKAVVIVGTVKGDIHDIGKTLVGAMLSASGFTVVDLGADVPIDRFVEVARDEDARLICTSALLTTTMVVQKELIAHLRTEGIRDRYLVLVGGAPVSRRWADAIGADGYAPDAPGAVQVAESLLSSRGVR
jgi:corrinoid protein of di/trimethylamine methyltransferase